MKQEFSVGGFIKSVFSYSVATWVNFLIYGLSIILATYFIPPQVFGPVDVFISTSTLIMSVCAMGLDQAYTRFFHEPPGGIGKQNLFTLCVFLSGSTVVVLGAVVSVFFSQPMQSLFFTEPLPDYVTPLLFLNALFLILARYYNITYRMQGAIKLYSLVAIGLQFFSRLFFIVGAFVRPDFLTIVLFYTGGLFVFVVIFALVRRDRLLPRRKDLSREALSYILPFGIAVAPATIIIWVTNLFSRVYVGHEFGETTQGVFSMALTLSNVIAVIQAGFATFWSAYIYANYKQNQQQIMQVHDYVTFLTCLFFAAIVAFEDILFFILGAQYRDGMQVFLLLSLLPLFLIISETTVYGISIKRLPIYDTIGFLISLSCSVLFAYLLTPYFGLQGTALGLALAGIVMFVFRTVISHKFYRMIQRPKKTAFALFLVVLLAILGTIFTNNYLIKFTISFICVIIWCYLYRTELALGIKYLRDAISAFKAKRQ